MKIKEEINKLIIDLLTEGVETKNMKLAKHFLYDKFGYNEGTALRVIGSIKTDIPNSRLGKCKFMLALVRMLMNGEFNDPTVIMETNKCLRYAASDAHINEYDNDLNGLSAAEFIKRFSGVASQDLQNDIDVISSQEYTANREYEIVKIDSFEESEEYGDYVSWCVTYDKGMYNAYTKGGNGVFYFCLRNGYEDEEEIKGEGCPLDSYGLSMIAVSVNSDGSCNTITCRWNHDNGGNDNIMSTKQLSELLGVNFYSVFKPLTQKEIEEKKHERIYEIEEELSSYMGYESPDELGCDELSYNPDYNDTIEENFYIFDSNTDEGCVLINSNWELAYEDIFEDISGDRRGDIVKVSLGDKYNFLHLSGKLLSNIWFDKTINEFDYGIGLCMKNNKWNVIKNDGHFIFDEWYKGIALAQKFNDKIHLEIINDKKNMMLTDLNGKPLFNKWIEDKRHYLVYDFLKFEGDNYWQLYYSNTNKLAFPYKISKIISHVNYNGEKYSRVMLIDGSEYYLNHDNGELASIDSLKGVV